MKEILSTATEKYGFLGKKVLNIEVFKDIEKIISPYGAVIPYDGSYKSYKIYHSTTHKPDVFSKLKFTGEEWTEAIVKHITIFSNKIVLSLDNKKHVAVAEGVNAEVVEGILNTHKKDFEKIIGIKLKFGKEEFIEKKPSSTNVRKVDEKKEKIKKNFNERDISKYWKWLNLKNAEIRLIGNRTFSEFADSEDKFVEICKKYSGKYHVYVGINEREGKGTKTEDIKQIKNFVVDLDVKDKNKFFVAQETAVKIKEDAIKKSYQEPLLDCSGGGFHLSFALESIENTEENRARIKALGKNIKEKYEVEGIKIDEAVFEVARVMRVAGTKNIKPDVNVVSFIVNPEIERVNDKILTEKLLSFKPKSLIIKVGKLETSLTEIISRHEDIKKLFNAEPEVLKKFVSRSEAEESLVCRLISIGLNKEQLFKVMASCKIGKWQEANIQYRELTYKKALEIISRKKKEEGLPKSPEEIKGYADIPIIQESDLNILGLIFEGIEKISLNPLQFNRLYKIYKSKIGVGHKPNFIITKPNETLNFGSQSLRLKQLNFEELFKDYCKGKAYLLPAKNNVFSKDELKKYEEEELSTLEIFEKEFKKKRRIPFFFEKISATSIQNLIKAVKKIGFANLLNDFIDENTHIDERLKYVFRIDKLSFGNECIPEMSRYNNHGLIISNTKTGKSTQLSKHTKLKYDSATANRLLGYSSGEKSFEGDIQQQYKLIALDDFASANYQEEILDNLPSILENGNALIGKGKKQILTECSSPFILTTNANRLIEERDLVLEFIKIINRLSETPQRIGSRFSYVLFGNNFKEIDIENFKFSKNELKVNVVLIEEIFEKISDFLLRLTGNNKVEIFLEKKNKDYRKIFENISKNEQNFFGELRDFWESTKSGDRHQRGFALKQGLIDFFLENEDKLILLLKDNLEITEEIIQEIINFSEENLARLNDLNFQSLRNIITIQKSETEYLQSRLDSLKQEYLKEMIKATLRLKKDKPQEDLIPLIMLNEYLDKNSSYPNQAKIIQKLPNDFFRINRDLKVFGIELMKEKGEILIQIHKESSDIAYKVDFTKQGEIEKNVKK